MGKFKKAEVKKSLLNGITLMTNKVDFQWVEFYEIENYIKRGYYIFNDEKRNLYSKGKKK